jgi:putative membrane-bound dehydrogenase-like protein
MSPARSIRPLLLIAALLAAGPLAAAENTKRKVAPAGDPALSPPPDGRKSNELVLHKWSGEINVPDPVSVAVDPQGNVYASNTTRRKVGDIDIREHTMWIPNDVGFTSVEDKRRFIRESLAPGKMRVPRGGIQDHNRDGSIDWKDLTFYSERIYQLRDTNGDGTADKISLFAEGFNTEVTGIAAGVMFHDGWLYATIAPDLWRFKDTDGDGVADIREVVVHGFGVHMGYAGHDMHGLTVGPDGRIYWSIGDKGVNVTSKEGRSFYFPNEGCIMRIEPDGSNFEIYAHGVRNPQEPQFDDFGDLFAVDNDADMAGEHERFVYIPEASDSGWRCNYQYMKEASPWMREGIWRPAFPGQATYFLPPIQLAWDGPAGFRHEPGTALGDAQRGTFVLNEFPSGKMRSFRIVPDGASFRMADQHLVNDGVMGIGFAWHANGKLFMADWIGGYPLDGIGAVWSIDTRANDQHPLRAETQQLLATGFAQTADDKLVKLLGHADQRVRQGAQLELAKRGRADAFLKVAGDGQVTLLARVHALWGYGQLLRRAAAAVEPVLPLLGDANDEIRRQTIKIIGDAAATGAKTAGARLIPLLNDPSPRVRSLTAIALGKFQERTAVEPLFALAARDAAGSAVLRHAAVTGLTGCATPAELAARRTDPSVNVRLAAVVALRRQRAAEVATFLADADPLVVQEAALAIHDERGVPAALPALAAVLDRRPANEFVARRAINAGLRLGTPEAASRLLQTGLDANARPELRTTALTALKVWNTPPPLDLVDGYARKFTPAAIVSVLTPRLADLLALTDPALRTLAIEIMIAHQLPAAPDQVAAIVTNPAAADGLRAQSLRLMAGADPKLPAMVRALEAALAEDAPAALHRAGLELLLGRDPARLVTVAATDLARRSTAEKQQALALLARAGRSEADALLATQGQALVAGQAAKELQLDILEALRARGQATPALQALADRYVASEAGAARRELLAGGDVARGRDIVANHLNANCTACHTVEAAGGSEVGPNLRAIGATRDAAYLLESLLEPSAKIATGYGIVNVTLNDKTEITGTLAKESKDAVTVRLFDGTNKTIPRASILNQTNPVSVMPAMGAILQPTEIRDVVTYLSNLKGGRRSGRSDGEL